MATAAERMALKQILGGHVAMMYMTEVLGQGKEIPSDALQEFQLAGGITLDGISKMAGEIGLSRHEFDVMKASAMAAVREGIDE